MIGLECQGSDANAITSLAQSKGANFQITTGGALEGSNVRGIPHGFLFGPDGKLASDDPSMGELETKLQALLKEAVGAMAGPGPYTKLAPLAEQIKTGRGLGGILATLRTKKESTDAETAKEASMMYEALSGAATSKLDRAMSMKDSDPVGALNGLEEVAKMFMGDETGTKAKTEAATLRKDPKISKELKASAILATIIKMEEGLKPYRGDNDPSSAGFKKQNFQAITTIIGFCQQLTKQYPDSQSAQKAEALMNKYK